MSVREPLDYPASPPRYAPPSAPAETEINLYAVLRQFGQFVRASWSILLIAFVVGVIGGVTYYYLKPPVYRSTLSAFSENLFDEQIKITINELDKMVRERDMERLAQALQLPVETVRKIGSLQAAIQEDKIGNEKSNTFQLHASVNDPALFPDLQTALLRYLNASDYAQRMTRLRQQELRDNMAQMDEEIRYLRELKNDLRDVIVSGEGRQNLFFSDLDQASTAIAEMVTQRNAAQRELGRIADGDILVVKSFVVFSKQYQPRLGQSLIFFTLAALLVGLGVSLVTNRSHLRLGN